MFTPTETLANANKATGDAILHIANTMFNNAERIVTLNMTTVRTTLQDGVSSVNKLMDAKGLDEFFNIQSSLAQPTLEKAMAYSRDLFEISSQSNSELSKVLESQFAELNKSVVQVLDEAAKSAPEGADMGLAAVKSAIGAANITYENMAKAAKQAAETAETYVATATKAMKSA